MIRLKIETNGFRGRAVKGFCAANDENIFAPGSGANDLGSSCPFIKQTARSVEITRWILAIL